MLSLEQIRNEPDAVAAALVRRAEDDDCLDEILALDTERRVAITDGDNLRSRRNQVSREIGQARAQGQQPPDDVVAEMRNVGQQISDLEETVRTLDVRINGLLMELPNLPDATTLTVWTNRPTGYCVIGENCPSSISRRSPTGIWPSSCALSTSNAASSCRAAGSTR